MPVLAPKRKTISKAEAAERANKLTSFLDKPDIKESMKTIKIHKRANWIRTEFQKETGLNIPVSSIYKLLRDTENNIQSPTSEPAKTETTKPETVE